MVGFDGSGEPPQCSPWPNLSQRHLLKTLFGPDEAAPDEYAHWSAAVDLDVGLDFGSYRLLPMLDYRLRQLGISDQNGGRIRGIFRRSWMENSLLFARVGEVLNRLADAGVPTMVLKGGPLALIHYPEHACRPMSDIDLLVPDADARRAEEAITAFGWERLLPRRLWIDRLTKHAAGFASGELQLDLHWRPLYEAHTTSATQWFWREAMPMELGAATTLRPRPTALLLNVVIHGLRDNSASPIRWLADAVMILRSEPGAIDWDDLCAFALRERIGWRLGLGLDYLRQHFSVPVPAEVPTRLLAAGQGIFERANNITLMPSGHRRLSGVRRFLSRATRKGLRTVALLDHLR